VEKCVACQFYDRGNGQQADSRGIQWGQCRRSAPRLHPVNQKAFMIEGVWPHVRDDDWCGEWKAGRRLDSRPVNDFSATGPLHVPAFSGMAAPRGEANVPLARAGSLMPPAGGTFSSGPPAGPGASVSALNTNGAITPAAASAFGGVRSATSRNE